MIKFNLYKKKHTTWIKKLLLRPRKGKERKTKGNELLIGFVGLLRKCQKVSKQIKKETTTLRENHKFQAKPAFMPLFVSVRESFSLLFKIITQYSHTKKKTPTKRTRRQTRNFHAKSEEEDKAKHVS